MDKLPIASLCSLTFLIASILINTVHGTPITSCSQTPYPKVCSHYMGTPNFETKVLYHTNPLPFYHMSLKVTMDHAIETHRSLSTMDLSSFDDERAKSAWYDCLELFQDMVHHLNRCTKTKNNSPNLDTQTWLSAAITNQQTCQNGFIDFNMTSHLQYLPSNNLSKLLSNSLAIVKAAVERSSSATLSTRKQNRSRKLLSREDFPAWVPRSDRRLLERSGGGSTPRADLIVAQDGSGDYRSISEAVAAAAKLRGKKGNNKRFVIYVKGGVYKENVEIKKTIENIMVVGDGIDATVVTGSRNVQDGSTTFRSATFAVSGKGFIARDITFENTAGPEKNQAVAFRSGSDFSVVYRCGFRGYQDTLYVYSQRQFYRDCDIYGTVDFIFGDAAAVLQNCNIYVRRPMSHQKNTVTAQAREDPNENTGIVIHNSRVAAAADLRPVQASFETYLGRPWQPYSRTVFMKTVLEGLVQPAGWLPWGQDSSLDTLYYAEYSNTGSGAATAGRVRWPGFHLITGPAEAGKFSTANFIGGDSWIPASGAPFDAGL